MNILIAMIFGIALIVSSLKVLIMGVAAIYSLRKAMVEKDSWLGNVFNEISGGKIKKKEQDKGEKQTKEKGEK